MSSDLENIVAALRALARDAAQFRPFVRDVAVRQQDILQELQALGARLPGAQRAMRALDASIDATDKIDPALAIIDQTATRFAERVLQTEAGTNEAARTTGARPLEEPATADRKFLAGDGGHTGTRPSSPERSDPQRPSDGAVPQSASGGSGGKPPEGDGTSAAPGEGGSSDPDVQPYLDKLPDRPHPGRGLKTRGTYVDGSADGQPLISGRKDASDETRNDRYYDMALARIHALEVLARPAPVTAAADVELKFAAYMREKGIRHAHIVINNKNGPCEGPLSCDALLPRSLGAGYTLTVHWPGNKKKTYVGEGDI